MVSGNMAFAFYDVGLVIIRLLIVTNLKNVYLGRLPMLLLQAIAVVFYFAQLVSLYAYLPEIERDVGQTKMSSFTTRFQTIQFGCQAGFLVVMAVIIFISGSGTVLSAQLSQAVNTVFVSIFLGVGWLKYIRPRDAVRELPEGHSIVLEGFRNNFKTMITIQKHFKKGIRWFFLAIAFGQAGMFSSERQNKQFIKFQLFQVDERVSFHHRTIVSNLLSVTDNFLFHGTHLGSTAAQSVTTLSSIYLAEFLQLGSLMTSLFFLDVLVVSLVGCSIGGAIARKTDPNKSYAMSYAYLFIVLMIGFLTMTSATPTYGVFIWGGFVGIGLGWLYAVEPLYLSCLVPEGQEAEIAGFYNFVTVILAWAPTLVFSFCTEQGVQQQFGFLAAVTFFLPGIILLMCSGKWEDVVEETKTGAVKAMEAEK